jgi:hypothetical protein
MTNAIKDIQETLQGHEIRSIQFEDLVTVVGDTVVDCYTGKVHHPTAAQWKELLNEAFREEFGTSDVEAVLRELGDIS